jgi:hypothetical protein
MTGMMGRKVDQSDLPSPENHFLGMTTTGGTATVAGVEQVAAAGAHDLAARRALSRDSNPAWASRPMTNTMMKASKERMSNSIVKGR